MLDKETLKILIENYDEFERMINEIAGKIDHPGNRNRSSYCESFSFCWNGDIEATMCYPRSCGCCSDDHDTVTFPSSLLFEEDWEDAAKKEGERRLAEKVAKEEEAKRLEQKKKDERKRKKDKRDYARLKKQFEEEQ